ncbi:hypothetical protein ACQ86N_15560 [Puia sp. P3]|uniref:glucuronyl esterase domain-containing protein n=1 Tax=Puia sp. P3 TaxID=3423952 RepID=UPI003D664176
MKNRLLLVLLAGTLHASAQPPVTFTAEQDHDNMMRQLGIKALRPGPSGDEKAPNHANYDEALANPYPELPDLLTLNDGKKITTADQWWHRRRPEIVEDFEREVYGRVPPNTPKITWTVKVTDHEYIGFTPVIAKQLVGHADNSSCPSIDVNINMTLVLPANAKGPVPLLMMFSRSALPAPAQPPAEDMEKINAAIKELLLQHHPELKEIFDRYPAYNPVNPLPGPTFGGLRVPGDPPAAQQLIADGWGYVLIDPNSIQADNGAGLTKGIIGLVNKGQPRKPDDWGALRAWAWGAARALDYLGSSEPMVDAKHVGIEGVSRFGKAALVTLAFEPRFYMGLIGSSGEGGAKLHRRNFGEAVESLTGGEYYWMAGNFLKYGASDATWRPENRERHPRRRSLTDSPMRSQTLLHQLWRPRTGRRQMARPAGQLYGHGRRGDGVSAARSKRHRRLQRLPHRKNAARQHRTARRTTRLAPARRRSYRRSKR